jgi:osmoprotectant transport system ATP-binding protein
MIELKNVTKSYGQVRVLGPIELHVPAGRTTLLIGPSGCGKSTLLRLMIGLIQPDSGTVRFEGHAVTSTNTTAIRRKMGYVIQEGGLFPHLTARENVTLVARHLRRSAGQQKPAAWDSRRISEKVAELAELTQFPTDALDRYPAQISGGQRQRVSLMRALMLDPEVLLFDEPLGALDPMIRADLQNDLKRIFQTLKKTVVMVTHDIGEAGFFSDRLVLLRDGCIIQQGTLRDLVRKPADPFVTRFINAQRSPLETVESS